MPATSTAKWPLHDDRRVDAGLRGVTCCQALALVSCCACALWWPLSPLNAQESTTQQGWGHLPGLGCWVFALWWVLEHGRTTETPKRELEKKRGAGAGERGAVQVAMTSAGVLII